MILTRNTILVLQRHFLGALSTPARTWLEPLPAARLTFAGRAIRAAREGGLIDMGVVESPGEERQVVRVCNAGPGRIDVRFRDVPPWLTARWIDALGDSVSLEAGAAGARLELAVVHDDEQEFHGSLCFAVMCGDAPSNEELTVRMTARRSHPYAQLDFNGSPVPREFDFSVARVPYQLSVINRASVPLLVSFAGLPAWLRFEVDGHDRIGPVEERFFERVAPFTVRIHAVAGAPVSGRQRSAIRIETNDPRPEFRSIELPFAAAFKRPRRSTPTPKALKDRPPRRWIRVPAEMLIVVAVFAIVLVIALLIFMRGLG